MADSIFLTEPGALRFLLLLPVIVLLYMVRARYRRRRVSSTMLWRSARRDLEARQRLRLPPISLLMLMQLLAVAVGAAALARPALPTQDRTHLVVLVDVSASMEATDVAPSRFEVAVQRARQAIRQARPGDQVSLVRVGSSPTLISSGTEMAGVLAALDHVRPGAAAADVVGALRLAESLIRKTGGHGQVLLLSDGAFGSPFRVPELAVPVDFQPIGVSGENQGITALEVRPDLDGSGRWSAFARVGNFADHPVHLKATAMADGLLLDSRPLEIARGSSAELSFALPPGTRSFALELDSGDPFPTDDRAEVKVDEIQPRRVLVVSRNSEPIEKVLRSLPGVEVSTVMPDSYQGAEGADLVILDGFVPPNLPQADMLIMNPPETAPGFVVKPLGAEAPVLRSKDGSPLIRSVDLRSLRLGQSVQIETPEWAHAVVEGPLGPLILQGDMSGRRTVLFSFDWLLFDLPRMQAFPLLLSNAVAELNPTALPPSVRPGDSVLLRPVADAREVTVEMPDGSRHRLSLDQGARSFGNTTQSGSYRVTWRGSSMGDVSSSFNVNVTEGSLSDIGPRSYYFDHGGMGRAVSTPVPGRQLWPALTLLLLALLTVEWAYFSRRS